MKAVVLVDNSQHPDNNLCIEHGLSIYFEFENKKWLFDVGGSDKFYINAKKLNIDIADVDYLVISHGHNDHNGGLKQFVDINKKAEIIISTHIKNKSYFSYNKSNKRDISIDYNFVEKHISRFKFIENNILINNNIGIICNFNFEYNKPKANNVLYESSQNNKEILDVFKHEIVLTINTENGIIVFSGCSHNGILNILSSCSNFFPDSKIIACLGGTHLTDNSNDYSFESENEIMLIGKTISKKHPGMNLFSGHCTGVCASKLLSSVMKNNYKTIYSGLIVDL